MKSRRWWVTDPMARYNAEVQAGHGAARKAHAPPPVKAGPGHPYSPTCGCPGCQYLWAAEETFRAVGSPLKIGEFTPTWGDFAEDPRYPGFFRTWSDGWHPKLLRGEPVCICKGDTHSKYGCLVDDSTLPVPVGIDQSEAMRRRNGKLESRRGE